MSIIIQYPKQFSKEYKDFIIVLSKLSELKNIKNLPFDVNIFIKNKELEKILQDNHYYESFVRSNKYKYFHNIKLILLNNLKNDQFILEGAKLFSKFNKNTNNELNFIFSTRLIKNYNNLCSNILFRSIKKIKIVFLLKVLTFSVPLILNLKILKN